MSIMLISRKGNTIMKLKMKLVVGLLAGIICGLFGTGGGMLLVPYFIYILKYILTNIYKILKYILNLYDNIQ